METVFWVKFEKNLGLMLTVDLNFYVLAQKHLLEFKNVANLTWSYHRPG